jgi:hypothetical protein
MQIRSSTSRYLRALNLQPRPLNRQLRQRRRGQKRMSDQLTTGFSLDELSQGSIVSKNVNQEVIVTTRDRVHLCLIKHQTNLQSRQDWLVPFGILLTIILTLTTADFKKDALGVDGDTWRALFLMGLIVTTVWLVITGRRAINTSATAVEDVINNMRTPPPQPNIVSTSSSTSTAAGAEPSKNQTT